MSARSLWAGIMGLATLVCGLSTPAMAQTPEDSFYFSGRPYGALDYYLDGPPDTAGCVKQCMRDYSPCDTPLFKKTDNRCTNVSRGR